MNFLKLHLASLSLPHCFRTLPCAMILAGGFATTSHGTLISNFDTGATGTPGSLTFTTGGDWAGDGTVQPFNTASGGPNSPLVTGFSGGTLNLTDISLTAGAAGFTPAGFSIMHGINITGGTADIEGIYNLASPAAFANIGLTPTAGSTCIEYTTFFSDPLHSRRKTGNNALPWLGSLEMPDSANATITIGGISTLTSTDGTVANATFSPGIAGGLGAATSTGRSLATFTQPTPTSLQWFRDGATNQTHINSLLAADPGGLYAGSSNGAYSAASLGNAVVNEGERVHAQSITWVLKPDSGTFTGNETFIFSFDGARSAASVALPIPEPARATLLALGVLAMAGRRRRA